jgi:hypothetical protein
MEELEDTIPDVQKRMITSMKLVSVNGKKQYENLFNPETRQELDDVQWHTWTVRVPSCPFNEVLEKIKKSIFDGSPSLKGTNGRQRMPSKKLLKNLARNEKDYKTYLHFRFLTEYLTYILLDLHESSADATEAPKTPQPKRSSFSHVDTLMRAIFSTPAAGGMPAGAAAAAEEVAEADDGVRAEKDDERAVVDNESSNDDEDHAEVAAYWRPEMANYNWAEKYADKMQFRVRRWLTPKWTTDPDFTGKRFQKLCGSVSFTKHEMDRIIQVIALYGDMPMFRHHTMFIAPAGSDGDRDMYLKGVRNHTGEGISVGYLRVTVNQHMHIISADRNHNFVTSESELPDGFRPYCPLHPYKNFAGETLPGRQHIPIDPTGFLGAWFAPYFYASF